MVKIKVNPAKGRVTMKMDQDHFDLIIGLLDHVVLGMEGMPLAAFEILEAFENSNAMDDTVKAEVSFDTDYDGDFYIIAR